MPARFIELIGGLYKVVADARRDNLNAPALRQRRRQPATYIHTDEGWLFLAVVIDLFSRQVVGWSLLEDMTRDIVIDALRMAWFKRHPSKQAGLILHSDRGSQYASQDFRDVLTEYGITASMSRRGNCWDNACSETLFGSLKVERLHRQRFVTRRQAKDETIAWLLWYNQTRLHSTLAYVSPVQFEQDWRLRPSKSIRDLAMGYGFQGQGQFEWREALGTSKHMFSIWDHAFASHIRVVQGRYEEAQALLDAAPVLGKDAASRPEAAQYMLLVPRMRARIKLAAGHAASAASLLPPDATDDWPPDLPFDTVMLRGETECATGQRERRLAHIEKSLAWHAAKLSPLHP